MSLLQQSAAFAESYVHAAADRRVFPSQKAIATALERFSEPLPADGSDPVETLSLLHEAGSPATVATTGGRYFGFVNGAVLEPALAANWLAGAWDQNAALAVMSPVAAILEDVVLRWVIDLLGLPAGTGGGFVTGATMANFAGLAAARNAMLSCLGWDVEANGLFGAPPIEVLVSAESHMAVRKALGFLGLGRSRVTQVPTDSQGRMIASHLPSMAGPAIVCIQAGNVNTGAFDPAAEVCAWAKERAAWVHVDGAFGIWATASPRYKHLFAGFEQADSWATDAHKWPNSSYDCGLVLVRNPEHLRSAMSVNAPYLPATALREPMQYTPESSRRARAVELWASLRTLGRVGLAALVDRTCDHARLFADGLASAGLDVLNEVVINQVLVSFGSDECTREVIARLQKDGTCWFGGTEWHGRAAMRISVCSHVTTRDDVERSVAAIVRIANSVWKEKT